MLESDTKGGLPGVRKSILAICLWYKVSDIRIVEFARQVEVVFCLGTLYDEIKYALKTAKSFTLIVIAIAVSSLICRIYWQNSPPYHWLLLPLRRSSPNMDSRPGSGFPRRRHQTTRRQRPPNNGVDWSPRVRTTCIDIGQSVMKKKGLNNSLLNRTKKKMIVSYLMGELSIRYLTCHWHIGQFTSQLCIDLNVSCG